MGIAAERQLKGEPNPPITQRDDLGVAGVIVASERSWTAPFTRLQREDADQVCMGQPRGFSLEGRTPLVAAY